MSDSENRHFAISATRARADVEEIVRNIPHRAAGSENGRRMAEYSRDALLEEGIHAEIQEFPAVVSFPEHAKLTLPSGDVVEANTLGHSVQTPAGGVSGRLVYVGSGAFSEYEGLDVTGCIILTELSYSPARHEKQRIAALRGAIGAVMMNWGPPDNVAVPFGSVKPCWGVPTPENMQSEMPTLPCIGVSRVDGLKLKEMALNGGVDVCVETHVENGWRPVQITVGEISPPNGPESDDFVLLGGHQDSWPGEAATDNAAGNACMIELARLFNARRSELRRGIVLGFWTAHETGTMAGSAWYVDSQWQKLRDHAVAYLQIDQPACIGTTTIWGVDSNAEMKSFLEKAAKPFLSGQLQTWHRHAKDGDSSLFGLGVPIFRGQGSYTPDELKASSLATLGWWHHSLENTLDKIDWEWLQTHLEVYAAWLWELCTAPVLPFRYTPVATMFRDRLLELEPAGRSIQLDLAVQASKRFEAVAKQLDLQADELSKNFDMTEQSEASAKRLNDCMKQISRIIVPLQSTAIGKYGHDTYGYTPQTTMIPVLYDIQKLQDLPDGEDLWMLQTKLVRERNKVIDGLDSATKIITSAIN